MLRVRTVETDDTSTNCDAQISIDAEFTLDSFDVTPGSFRILDNIAELVSVTPVIFQVTKPAEELQPSTLRYLKRKILQIQDESIRTAIESIAPRQGEKLQDILFPCATDSIPIDLENLYMQSKIK